MNILSRIHARFATGLSVGYRRLISLAVTFVLLLFEAVGSAEEAPSCNLQYDGPYAAAETTLRDLSCKCAENDPEALVLADETIRHGDTIQFSLDSDFITTSGTSKRDLIKLTKWRVRGSGLVDQNARIARDDSAQVFWCDHAFNTEPPRCGRELTAPLNCNEASGYIYPILAIQERFGRRRPLVGCEPRGQ